MFSLETLYNNKNKTKTPLDKYLTTRYLFRQEV